MSDAVKEWQEARREARWSLEFDRERVGAPGCLVRTRAVHLLRTLDEWDDYRAALCRIASMGGEAGSVALETLKKWRLP